MQTSRGKEAANDMETGIYVGACGDWRAGLEREACLVAKTTSTSPNVGGPYSIRKTVAVQLCPLIKTGILVMEPLPSKSWGVQREGMKAPKI